jgi:hypothetical protein
MDNGYNPMRWKCAESGCFNLHARPKVEIFARLFPRRCSMGDIDYEVELNGYFLRVEFKRFPGKIPDGQRILFDNLLTIPRKKFTVLCVALDARTMQVSHVMLYTGPQSEWMRRDLAWLEEYFDWWQAKAVGAPRWHA